MNKTFGKKFYKNFGDQIFFWRKNIHRFCMEYMGVKLAIFQQILIYMMDSPHLNTINSFIFFASRGLGKSFLTMVFCLAKATLYPGIKIVVASSVFNQAIMLIKQAELIKEMYPNIANEILEIKTNKDNAVIIMKNGSRIIACVASDSARGLRANILILDESRLMDKNIISTVLENFLTLTHRGQSWSQDDRYKEIVANEHNSKIFLTSIGYKDEWSYVDYMKYIGYIINNREDYVVMSLPYQFGIEAGFIDESYITSKVRENRDNIETLQMELEVIPYGETESAVFKFDDLNKARKIRSALIPVTDSEFIELKGNIRNHKYYQAKQKSEIRIISMDIAVAEGRQNDNSAISVFRLFPNDTYYDKELSYIEVVNGMVLDQQMLRLKQLFYDLECDYVCIDAMGALGHNAMSTLSASTKDEIRGVRYPGWKTMNNMEKWDGKVIDQYAVEVLFPIQISGVNASTLQYNMVVSSRLELERKRLVLPCTEDSAIDYLNKAYNFMKLKTSNDYKDREIANNMINTHKNTDRLVKEAVSTKITKLPSGRYTIQEKDTKDILISMLYGLYFINKLEDDLYEVKAKFSASEYGGNFGKNYKPKNNVKNPFINNINRLGNFGRR